MEYEDARELAIRASYAKEAKRLASEFVKGRRTVVVLPGGMGSQLRRSKKAWKPADGADRLPSEVSWLALNVCQGAALDLGMTDAGGDQDDHIVTPDGEVRQVYEPYNGVYWYLRSGTGQPKPGELKGVTRELFNVATFGYDWRESVDDSAHWLVYFLSELRERVRSRPGFLNQEPLDDITLLAHSQGGLVAKLFLNLIDAGGAPELPPFTGRVITAGTPFYGTDTIINHFFKTMPVLKNFAPYRPYDQLPRVVANFPGPYILWFADARTVLTPATLRDMGLDQYPLRDFDTHEPINPYDVNDPAIAARFPSWVRQEFATHVPRAVECSRQVASAFETAGLKDRLFHIRGVDNSDTGALMLWKAPDGGAFNPENADGHDTFEKWPGNHGENHTPDEKLKLPNGLYGDGLVPHWSAALADADDDHVFDLPWNDQYVSEHLSLLESRRSLHAALYIMQNDKAPSEKVVAKSAKAESVVNKRGVEAITTPDGFSPLVRALAEGDVKPTDPRVRNPAFARALYREALGG